MTDVATQRSTLRSAVEILVQREVAASRPDNPGAYAGSVRSRLLNDKRDLARALLEDDPNLTPETLAQALDDTPDIPAAPARSEPAYGQRAPSLSHFDRRVACPTCHCYGGDGWMPAPDRDDHGLTADLEPCPVCAVDRVRDHHHHSRPGERDEMHRRYRQGIDVHRAKHGTSPDDEAMEVTR